MRTYVIIAKRAKSGKRLHQRGFVQARNRTHALRQYGCNVKRGQYVATTKRGWKLTAEPVA